MLAGVLSPIRSTRAELVLPGVDRDHQSEILAGAETLEVDCITGRLISKVCRPTCLRGCGCTVLRHILSLHQLPVQVDDLCQAVVGLQDIS